MHAPINSLNSESPWMLLAQFVSGLLLAGVYLRTGNLFVAIGLHTLINDPAPLIAEKGDMTNTVIAIISVAIMILGPSVMRLRRGRKAVDRPVE
jgi:membrane protease YdiL (CAAX protease family)